MWLARAGVPFDVAFAVDDVMRAAMAIVISEQGGRKFHWDRMEFEDD